MTAIVSSSLSKKQYKLTFCITVIQADSIDLYKDLALLRLWHLALSKLKLIKTILTRSPLPICLWERHVASFRFSKREV